MISFKQFCEDFSGGATTVGSVAGIGVQIAGRPNQAEPPKKGPTRVLKRKQLEPQK